jgi:hypothetical protein
MLISGVRFAAPNFGVNALLLIADKRTASSVEVDLWRYNGGYWEWAAVASVQPRQCIPFSPIRAGDRFRRRVPGQPDGPTHIVPLYNDAKYGGPQDICLLQ